MLVNKYVDIATLDKEAKKDYIDRHSVFIHLDGAAKKGQKYKVKVKVGNEYLHPDDADHYIAWVQLWDGEKMLTQANFIEGALGNAPAQVEVDFYIVPNKKTLKLTAQAFCTKHGLWQSEEKVVEVTE